jgi:hypothetical protein
MALHVARIDEQRGLRQDGILLSAWTAVELATNIRRDWRPLM